MAKYEDEDEIISYSEDPELNEDELTESEKSKKLQMPISGSPLVVGPTLANSPKPLAQGQYPNTQTTDDNISRSWSGIFSFYG